MTFNRFRDILFGEFRDGVPLSAFAFALQRYVRVIIKLIVMTVRVFLSALELFMFIRAILSWVMPANDNKLTQFFYITTEPFIYPVRKLMDKIGVGEGLPVDMSFFVTFMIISVLRIIL